jgi:hypothetical protein
MRFLREWLLAHMETIPDDLEDEPPEGSAFLDDLDAMIDRLLAADTPDTLPLRLHPEARALLRAHRWPGNLRELRNALDCARSVCSVSASCSGLSWRMRSMRGKRTAMPLLCRALALMPSKPSSGMFPTRTSA